DVDRALAERLEVDHPADRAADQALDLHRPAVRPPARDVALLALAGGGREHSVLGSDPAAPLPGQPARHVLHRRRSADHARAARLDQRRARGRADEAGRDRQGPQLVGRAPVVPRLGAHAARLASLTCTCRTLPSGIWRKRVPTLRNASGSPVARKPYRPRRSGSFSMPSAISSAWTASAIA